MFCEYGSRPYRMGNSVEHFSLISVIGPLAEVGSGLTLKFYTACRENIPGTNTLASFSGASVKKTKSFMTLSPEGRNLSTQLFGLSGKAVPVAHY